MSGQATLHSNDSSPLTVGSQLKKNFWDGKPTVRGDDSSIRILDLARSVTASFGHYHRSGSTYVVPDLHGKNGHVDLELSC